MLREFFGQDTIEEKLAASEKKYQQLLEKVAEVDRETLAIFEQLEVTPAQIDKFLGDKDNFSEEVWEEIQRQMGEIEQKATARRDVGQVRRAYKERAEIQRQWIFVR